MTWEKLVKYLPADLRDRIRNGSHRTIKLDTADWLADVQGCRLVIGRPRKHAP